MTRMKREIENLTAESLEDRVAPLEALTYTGPREIDPMTGGDEPVQLQWPGGSGGVRRDIYHR